MTEAEEHATWIATADDVPDEVAFARGQSVAELLDVQGRSPAPDNTVLIFHDTSCLLLGPNTPVTLEEGMRALHIFHRSTLVGLLAHENEAVRMAAISAVAGLDTEGP
jgi:hypothetical protein